VPVRYLLLVVLLSVGIAPSALRAATSPSIKVGILREQDRVAISSERQMELVSSLFQRVTLPAGNYDVISSPGAIEISGVGQFPETIRILPAEGARLRVATRAYRGIIEIRRTPSGRLTAINELDVEGYLYGVLKLEVDPRWPPEALKAQAVASRTIAFYSLGRYAREGFDVRPTTETQVYGGVLAEDARTNAAVDATRGEIITFADRPIFAAFHSDSGGHTESSEYVWGGRYFYLKGVSDPHSVGAASQQWIARFDLAAIEERLRRTGKSLSGVTGIEVTETSPSGRAQSVRITSEFGTLTLRGTEMRSLLGEQLKSTLFSVRVAPDTSVIFTGRGSGHGVGMSQWGARGLAQLGRSYQEILRYYYSGISFETR
jgi:stage II sporulation protein D